MVSGFLAVASQIWARSFALSGKRAFNRDQRWTDVTRERCARHHMAGHAVSFLAIKSHLFTFCHHIGAGDCETTENKISRKIA